MNICKSFGAVVLTLLFSTIVVAQSYQATHDAYWRPSVDSDYHEAIVKITGDGYGGSGTVVKRIKDAEVEGYYIGWILTASHVINNKDTKFRVYFNNGAITQGGTVVVNSDYSSNSFCDYGLIRAIIPNEVTPMELSVDEVPCGSEVEMCGFGRGSFKHWLGTYAGDKADGDGHIVWAFAVQGDSGGPIIYKGKVVGVICFGTGVERFGETSRYVVTPVYGTCVSRIKNLLEE